MVQSASKSSGYMLGWNPNQELNPNGERNFVLQVRKAGEDLKEAFD